MKWFIKRLIASLLTSACLSLFYVTAFAESNPLSETVRIEEGFVVSLPASLPAISIDESNLNSGYNYSFDSGTGDFFTNTDSALFCVYSNSPKAFKGRAAYSLSVDGTTVAGTTALKGTSASHHAVLPYSLIITDGAANSTTYTINSSNANSNVSGSSKFIASNVIGCSGKGTNGKGTIRLQIKGSDWHNAPADSYSANISLIASQL